MGLRMRQAVLREVHKQADRENLLLFVDDVKGVEVAEYYRPNVKFYVGPSVTWVRGHLYLHGTLRELVKKNLESAWPQPQDPGLGGAKRTLTPEGDPTDLWD